MPVAAMSIARCGASWAASTNSSAPCAWASSASCCQRPHLAGDVGRAGDRQQVDASQHPLGVGEQLLGRSGNGSRRRSCSRHGSMFAWCSTGVESTFVPGGSAWARTLIASVVLRTNTHAAVVGADEARDAAARLLIGVRGDPRLRAGAAVDAAVVGHERLDRVPYGGHHGRAGGVVEVHVAAHAAVGAGHFDVGADELRGRSDGGHAAILSHPAWRNLGGLPAPVAGDWRTALDRAPASSAERGASPYGTCSRPSKISATWPPRAPRCSRCCSRCSALPRRPTSARGAASRRRRGRAGVRAGARAGAAARRRRRAGERVGDGVAVAGRDGGDQPAVGLGEQAGSGGHDAAVELGQAVQGEVVGGGGGADREVVHGSMVRPDAIMSNDELRRVP